MLSSSLAAAPVPPAGRWPFLSRRRSFLFIAFGPVAAVPVGRPGKSVGNRSEIRRKSLGTADCRSRPAAGQPCRSGRGRGVVDSLPRVIVIPDARRARKPRGFRLASLTIRNPRRRGPGHPSPGFRITDLPCQIPSRKRGNKDLEEGRVRNDAVMGTEPGSNRRPNKNRGPMRGPGRCLVKGANAPHAGGG
jgi:hypothetical protein